MTPFQKLIKIFHAKLNFIKKIMKETAYKTFVKY